MTKKERDESRMEALAEYWDAERIVKTVSWFLLFVGIAVFVLNIVSVVHKTNIYETEIANMKEDIGVLEANIKSLTEIDIPEDESHSVLNIGNEVASLQNKYQGYENSYRGNGLEDDKIRIDELTSQLVPYFSENDSPSMWYYCPNIYYDWNFKTTYSFFDDKISVIWLCTQSSGDVLAYTTAIYDVNVKKFSDVRTYVTGYGNSMIELNDLENTATSSDANETIDDSESVSTEASTEITEEVTETETTDEATDGINDTVE